MSNPLFPEPSRAIMIDPAIMAAKHQLEEARSHYASEMLTHVDERIRAFEGALDDEHELGAVLSQLGARIVVRVREIQCTDPNLVIFRGLIYAGADVLGVEEGSAVELLQHVSQVTLMLVPLPTLPGEKAHRVVH
jgi:hypothetical protein